MIITKYEWAIARQKGNAVDVEFRQKAGGNIRKPAGVSRRDRKFTLNGSPITINELAKIAGIGRSTMSKRLNRMPPEEAIK